jgi:hypothetical protein
VAARHCTSRPSSRQRSTLTDSPLSGSQPGRGLGRSPWHRAFGQSDAEIRQISFKGPHPDLESDFTLFCEVITGALS